MLLSPQLLSRFGAGASADARSVARASISAQPSMFAPLHCEGTATSGYLMSSPMPQLRSFLAASAIS